MDAADLSYGLLGLANCCKSGFLKGTIMINNPAFLSLLGATSSVLRAYYDDLNT